MWAGIPRYCTAASLRGQEHFNPNVKENYMALPKLTQVELVDELVDSTGWTKGDVRHFLDALATVVEANVQEGYRVQVAGILVEPKLRKAQRKRMGRNPQTGEAVPIAAKPAKVVLKARPVSPLSKTSLPSPRKLASMV